MNLHVIGDSHLLPLNNLKLNKQFKILMCVVQGATASGLKNPRSQTLSGPIFENYLQNISKNDWVIIHLGEVDCGFVMWVRSERENISIEEQSNITLENYKHLLIKIKNKTDKIILINILPQSIKDGTKIGDIANLRGSIKANQKQRMNLTNKMNTDLLKICSDLNINYFNLNKYFIDNETGLLKDFFYNSNPEDHHLEPYKFLEIIQSELNDFFEKNNNNL